MKKSQQTEYVENNIILYLKKISKKVVVTIVEKSKGNPRDNIICVGLLKAYSCNCRINLQM